MSEKASDQVVVELKAEIAGLKRGLIEARTTIKGFADGANKDAASVNQGFLNMVSGLKGFLIASGGLAAVTGLVRSSLHAWEEQENAIVKLNATLKSTGQFTEQYSKELQDLSSEFQRFSTFGDEAVLEAERMLVSMGAGPDKIKPLTQAVLDLSAGLGQDLASSALLVGKAVAGEFGTLSRYGIIVDEGATKTEKLDQALKQIEQRFGGQALAATTTFSGQIEQLKNQVGDLEEDIGRLIVEFVNFGKSSDGLKNKIDSLRAKVDELRKTLLLIPPEVRSSSIEFLAWAGAATAVITVLGLVAGAVSNLISPIRTVIAFIVGGAGIGTSFAYLATQIRLSIIAVLAMVQALGALEASALIAGSLIGLTAAITGIGLAAYTAIVGVELLVQKTRELAALKQGIDDQSRVFEEAARAQDKIRQSAQLLGKDWRDLSERDLKNLHDRMGITAHDFGLVAAALRSSGGNIADPATMNRMDQMSIGMRGIESSAGRAHIELNGAGAGAAAASQKTNDAAKSADDYAKELEEMRKASLQAAESSVTLSDRLRDVARSIHDAITNIKGELTLGALRLQGRFFEADQTDIQQQAEDAVQQLVDARDKALQEAQANTAQIKMQVDTLSAGLVGPGQQGPETPDVAERRVNLDKARSELEAASHLEVQIARDTDVQILGIRMRSTQQLMDMDQKAALDAANARMRALSESNQTDASRQSASFRRDESAAPEVDVTGASREALQATHARMQAEQALADAHIEFERQMQEATNKTLNPVDRQAFLDQALAIEATFNEKEINLATLTADEKNLINRDSVNARLAAIDEAADAEIKRQEVKNQLLQMFGIETDTGLTESARQALNDKLDIMNEELVNVETNEARKGEIRAEIRDTQDQLEADSFEKQKQVLFDYASVFQQVHQGLLDVFTVTYLTIKDGAIQLTNPFKQLVGNLKSVYVNTINSIVSEHIKAFFKMKFEAIAAQIQMAIGFTGLGLSAKAAAKGTALAWGEAITSIKAMIPELLLLTAIFFAVGQLFDSKNKKNEPTSSQTTTGLAPVFEDLAPTVPKSMADVARQTGTTTQVFNMAFQNNFSGDFNAEGLVNLVDQIGDQLKEVMPGVMNKAKRELRDEFSLQQATFGLA